MTIKFSKLKKIFARNSQPFFNSYDSCDKIEIEHKYWISKLRSKFLNSYSLELDPVQFLDKYAPKKDEVALIQTENKGDPRIFYSTSSQSIIGYLSELEDHGYNPLTFNAILEFGVGYARLLRHFVPFQASLYGCDVTGETIHWCNRNLGDIAKFETTNFDPPLPYADEKFDYIFANSVFTHIQYEDTHRWIDELHRVTTPGGCVITSHYDVNEHLRNFDPEDLDRTICEKGYVEWGGSSVRENNIYFSPKKLKEIWGRKFEILDYRNYFKDQGHLVVRKSL